MDQLGPLSARSSGRFKPNAGAIADYNDSLPKKFRFAPDGNRARCGAHDSSRNPRRFAELNAVTSQILPRGLDVIDDQITTLGQAGIRSGDILAEDDRAAGARRRELNHAQVFAVVVLGVESPPESRVKLLRAIDVRDWDNIEILLLHASLWWNSLLSMAKNGRSKLRTRETSIHHQLDRVDVGGILRGKE